MSKKRVKEIIRQQLGEILSESVLKSVIKDIEEDSDWNYGGEKLPEISEAVLITDGISVINDALEEESGELSWGSWCDYPVKTTWWRPSPGVGFVYGIYDRETKK